MQPFYHYEGLKDRVEHQSRLNDAKEWFELARALGTDLILIPSNFLPKEDLCDDFDIHIQDLREVRKRYHVRKVGDADSKPR